MSVVIFDKGKLLYDAYLRLTSENRLEEAEEALLQSIELNESMAMHALAHRLYKEGKQNRVKAIALYKRAARLGFEASAWNLARHYDVTHQPKSYFYWLKISAELGEDDARLEMSMPFPFTVSAASEMEDRGLEKEALKLYRFAANHGNTDAHAAIARIERS